MKIDKTDEKIINELLDNSKISFRELAKKLKFSSVTIMNRIKRLEREGIIEKYTSKINYDLLGYDIHVIIDVRVSKGKLFELGEKVAQNPNIYSIYDTTGNFDATLVGKFRSTKTMDTFLKKIQTYDFVERTSTKLILNTIKEGNVKV